MSTLTPEPLPMEEPMEPKSVPLAVPPGQRGRGFPAAAAKPPPGKPGRELPPLSTKSANKPKRVIGNRVVKGMIPGQVPGTWESLKSNAVVNATGEINMSTLKDAVKLTEEMFDDELDALHGEPDGDEFGAPPAGGLGDMGTLDEPMEPPVSDSAIGADTEGETALGLLRQMKDLLTQLVVAVAPEAMPGAEGAEGGEMMDLGGGGGAGGPPMDLGGEEGGEGGESDMPPEPPSDEGSEAANEFEPEESEEESGESRPVPKKTKKPKGDEE
jgi:hypothetical protein